MNDNNVSQSAGLLRLAEGIGDFIRYWGFRRVHGQLWTLIYLSHAPLSGVELSRKLGVSKALVSPALRELEHHNLIEQVAASDQKTKRYRANPEVFAVIKKILVGRELPLVHRIQSEVSLMRKQCAGSPSGTHDLQVDRLDALEMWVDAANLVLTLLCQNELDETLLALPALLSPQGRDTK